MNSLFSSFRASFPSLIRIIKKLFASFIHNKFRSFPLKRTNRLVNCLLSENNNHFQGTAATIACHLRPHNENIAAHVERSSYLGIFFFLIPTCYK